MVSSNIRVGRTVREHLVQFLYTKGIFNFHVPRTPDTPPPCPSSPTKPLCHLAHWSSGTYISLVAQAQTPGVIWPHPTSGPKANPLGSTFQTEGPSSSTSPLPQPWSEPPSSFQWTPAGAQGSACAKPGLPSGFVNKVFTGTQPYSLGYLVLQQ